MPAVSIGFEGQAGSLLALGGPILPQPLPATDPCTTVHRRIAWQRSIICASPAYLDRRGRPEAVADIASHDCLAFAHDGRPLPWIAVDGDGALQTFTIRPKHSVSHGEALRDAAVNGLGIAYLSTWLEGDAARSGKLEILPIQTPLEEAPISVLWPQSRDLSPKVRVAVDALVAAFTPVPPWEAGG
ncbi:LysR substrate-binding domain-containing protein [Roseomonas mucosa]|uniref:LysR substrate-binding domain-containing protein n=1 Tax=Roseomonas mucosa TaxID=207340 RepID=UPI0015C54AC7|nr:LysR substrate-binding domain-containing protein [Roseomonas mucosa]